MMTIKMQIPRTDAKSLIFDHKILWVTGGYKTDGYRTKTTEFIDITNPGRQNYPGLDMPEALSVILTFSFPNLNFKANFNIQNLLDISIFFSIKNTFNSLEAYFFVNFFLIKLRHCEKATKFEKISHLF